MCLNKPDTSLGCNCVPENLCPAQDVDLRLFDTDDVCPVGMLCCDAAVDTNLTDLTDELDEASCDGVCVSDRSKCAGEDYDEYGEGLINIRTNDANRCPAGQYCCRANVEKSTTCDGTCLPKSLCTMFVSGDDCAEGNVCCRMDRNSWVNMINDINGMGGPDSDAERRRMCEWSEVREDGTQFPPWLVSVWARVEIIPGLHTDQFICGGVLVDHLLVLTTASYVKNLPADELFVNVGDYDIASRSAFRMQNIYTIKEKIIHENYNTSDPVHNNVALLRLTDTVYSRQCVASLDASPEQQIESTCYTIGWNRTLLEQGSGQPKRYPVQVTSFQTDLFCAPGTICLSHSEEHCDDNALAGSAIVCVADDSKNDWKLRGLLLLIDPITEVSHITVHTGNTVLTASDAPRNNTGLVVVRRRAWNWANERRATVTAARVLSRNASSTQEALVKYEPLAESGGTQRLLTLAMRHNRQLHLLQYHLIQTLLTEYVLAPAGSETLASVERGSLRWKTDRLDVLRQLEGFHQNEQSHIVRQRTFVKGVVCDDFSDPPVLMLVIFVTRLCVPLAGTYQQLILLNIVHAMGRGQNDVRSDQRTTTMVYFQAISVVIRNPNPSTLRKPQVGRCGSGPSLFVGGAFVTVGGGSTNSTAHIRRYRSEKKQRNGKGQLNAKLPAFVRPSLTKRCSAGTAACVTAATGAAVGGSVTVFLFSVRLYSDRYKSSSVSWAVTKPPINATAPSSTKIRDTMLIRKPGIV
uniref:Peptidase S1 domain-containing protein n=1 Tax=Anopheles culicifacies TaxID=139723 RepID=A0A182M6Q4_9DIPT